MAGELCLTLASDVGRTMQLPSICSPYSFARALTKAVTCSVVLKDGMDTCTVATVSPRHLKYPEIISTFMCEHVEMKVPSFIHTTHWTSFLAVVQCLGA